jgi:hypothetical protein
MIVKGRPFIKISHIALDMGPMLNYPYLIETKVGICATSRRLTHHPQIEVSLGSSQSALMMGTAAHFELDSFRNEYVEARSRKHKGSFRPSA